jgi:F-type H+-transporting ATPase subunit delta
MISGSIARRYAKALLSLGLEDQSQEAMARQLDELAHTLRQSAELREALGNPIFPLSERKSTMEAICTRLGLTRVVRNFVMLLLDRGRVLALTDIAREFGAMVDAQANRVRAKVTSATPLGPDLEARLRVALEKRHGKKVLLEKAVDPTLIGGLVTEVGDVTYDGSIRYQMENLKATLLPES